MNHHPPLWKYVHKTKTLQIGVLYKTGKYHEMVM